LTRHSTPPPWDFLLSASHTSLQSYELSRLNHAANLRKEIVQLVNNWVEENSAAMLARWLMDHREHHVCVGVPGAEPPEGSHSASDNFLAEPPLPRAVARGPV
jgi:hypothetical protein